MVAKGKDVKDEIKLRFAVFISCLGVSGSPVDVGWFVGYLKTLDQLQGYLTWNELEGGRLEKLFSTFCDVRTGKSSEGVPGSGTLPACLMLYSTNTIMTVYKLTV